MLQTSICNQRHQNWKIESTLVVVARLHQEDGDRGRPLGDGRTDSFLCLSCPPCPALYFYPSNALHSTCVVVRISMKNDTNNAHKTCTDIAVSNCWKGKFNILQRPQHSLYKHSAKFFILCVVIRNCVENRSGGGGFRCHRKQKRYDHSVVVTAAMSGAEKSRACRFPQVFQFNIYSYTLLKSVTLKALAAAATLVCLIIDRSQ